MLASSVQLVAVATAMAISMGLPPTASASGTASCPFSLHFGIGLNGDGTRLHSKPAENVSACCGLASTGGYAAFTFHNSTNACNLLQGPLRPHVSPGTDDATSGSKGPLPPPAPPPPGPPPLPPAHIPAAQSTMPTTPTFKSPPRPNIVLFFGDGELLASTPAVVRSRPR
jgi:hypothetical protein